MLRKEAQVRDLQQRLENGEGSKYLIKPNYLISECKLAMIFIVKLSWVTAASEVCAMVHFLLIL